MSLHNRPDASPRAGWVTPTFLPALEGMRALAALGVVTTHVAFQTQSVAGTGVLGTAMGAVWGRLDLAVAVFFALSGFLLWRPHAVAARGGPDAPSVRRYLRHRVVRIWPAYVVVVVAVLAVFPIGRGADATTWFANLFLVQVFVPSTLKSGLTQMWSLSVEVSFYAALPVVAWSLRRLRAERVRWRIPVLVTLGVVALGWGPLAETFSLTAGISPTLWLPGYVPWFVVGMVLAEMAATPVDVGGAGRVRRWSGRRVGMGVLAVVLYALSCTPLAGPAGLEAVSATEFATKMALGAALGWALIAPLVLAPVRTRLLASAPMLALGRWSYALFIWHLLVLSVVFGLSGFSVFGGSMLPVWIITVVASIAVSAASYGLVEEPARRAMRSRERARRPTSRRATNRDGGSDTASTIATATRAGTVTHQVNPV